MITKATYGRDSWLGVYSIKGVTHDHCDRLMTAGGLAWHWGGVAESLHPCPQVEGMHTHTHPPPTSFSNSSTWVGTKYLNIWVQGSHSHPRYQCTLPPYMASCHLVTTIRRWRDNYCVLFKAQGKHSKIFLVVYDCCQGQPCLVSCHLISFPSAQGHSTLHSWIASFESVKSGWNQENCEVLFSHVNWCSLWCRVSPLWQLLQVASPNSTLHTA